MPFDFTAKPVVAPPRALREAVQVKAMRPERDAVEIRFPRVAGYRVELPQERLCAEFNDDSVLVLTPDLVGPSSTRNQGIIGDAVNLSLEHNWIVLDSDREAEFRCVAKSHPRAKAYVKNHNLGLDVPYRYGSETRQYRPDFVVVIDDGRGDADPLHLVVEIKGYRRGDVKETKSTMETYWVPGVNNLTQYGRWAFAEFTGAQVYGCTEKQKQKERRNAQAPGSEARRTRIVRINDAAVCSG